MTGAGVSADKNGKAAAFYIGKVLHARLRPVPHRFVYRLFMLLIDLDRMEAAGRLSRFLSIGRFNLFSFHEGDHLPVHESREPLAGRVRDLFARDGIDASGCRIQLLCLPRVLGYAFNPIAVFYAITEEGGLAGTIYEVRNTFGERHSYIAAASDKTTPYRHDTLKQFHVSPFLPMNLSYRFSVAPPADTLRFRILESDDDGPLLSAGFSGRYLELGDFTALRVFFGLPLATLKVILGIHYEALRLYIKGLRVYPHPVRSARKREPGRV
jgi:uncharacterized protein